MAPHMFEGDGALERLHRWVYPPRSKYYWYRKGRVANSPLGSKYWKLLLLSLVVASAGSGTLMFAMAFMLTLVMNEWQCLREGRGSVLLPFVLRNESAYTALVNDTTRAAEQAMRRSVEETYVREAVRDPVFIAAWVIMAGCFTGTVYYLGANAVHQHYYVRQRSKAKEWKCQPNRWPTPELFREEQLTGCFNGFMSGALGCALFFLHQNYPFLKFYYTTDVRGFGHYLAGCVLVYIWVDFYSYWIHRLLHHRWIYKYVHKWHHRYKAPTAFGAFAIHPVEFIGFQTAGIWCCAVFPVHVMSFLTVVTYVAYHNQIDHSGVYYEGELPWVPSTKYHDDHHQYFHLNYGVTLVVWDWLFGTLRQSDRAYGEDIFVGDQDRPDEALASKVRAKQD